MVKVTFLLGIATIASAVTVPTLAGGAILAAVGMGFVALAWLAGATER